MPARRTARSLRHPAAAPAALCESLEPRLALSATVNPQGVLVVIGSPQADTIELAPGASRGSVIVTGVPGVPDGTQFDGVESVNVDLKSGDDTFTLTDDLLDPGGFAVNIRVLGGNGQDTITLNNSSGLPEVRGGNSHDTITGGGANDLLKGGRGIDTIFGGIGADQLEGQLGRDTLIGGPGNDSLFGGFQADTLWGNDGADLLNGGRHRDILFGGLNVDTLIGDHGADRFNGSPDEAQDFGPGDDNFSDFFDPEDVGVLLGPSFWDRLSAGEAANNGQLNAPVLQATNIIADAFAGAAAEFSNLLDVGGALTLQQREAVYADLLAITNDFSPQVLADPTALTQADLERLRDDLNAAIPSTNGVDTAYATWIGAMYERMYNAGYIDVVNQMVANAPSTQGHLYAVDSVWNLYDLD